MRAQNDCKKVLQPLQRMFDRLINFAREEIFLKRRMHHIFKEDGLSFVLAIDHAAMMPSPDLKDIGHIIGEAVQGGVDAFLASYGTVKNFQASFANRGIILRADGGVTPLKKPMGKMECLFTAQDALRVGADAMLAMGYPGSDNNEQSLAYLARLAADCEAWNLPLCAEMLPYGFEKHEGIDTRSVENIAYASRLGVELGADFIKTEFVGGERFREVADNCPAPVLVLGGGKAVSEEEMMNHIYGALQNGAKGIIMGRNICRHRNIRGICRAIAAIIHEGASPSDAMGIFNEQ